MNKLNTARLATRQKLAALAEKVHYAVEHVDCDVPDMAELTHALADTIETCTEYSIAYAVDAEVELWSAEGS